MGGGGYGMLYIGVGGGGGVWNNIREGVYKGESWVGFMSQVRVVVPFQVSVAPMPQLA